MGLVEHTRPFIRDNLPEKGMPALVDKEIKKIFAEDELSSFVQCLRNYMIHRGIPDVVLAENYNPEKGTYQVIKLRTADLVQYNRWNTKAKTFIESYGEAVPVSIFVEAYYIKVMDFQQWLRDRAFEC